MAQGDTVSIGIAELVEVTFQLDFKTAEVRARPDADSFAELRFLMQVKARKFTHITGPDSKQASPPVVDLTGPGDDRVVRVVFTFVGNKEDGTARFQAGDTVDLLCQFTDRDGAPADAVQPILLGTAKIQAAKAA